MPVANVNYLYDLSQEILDNAAAAFTDSGLVPPPRRYISPGIITDDVWENDCEQLAVQLYRIYTGVPGNEVTDPETCGNTRTLQFLIRITRCIDAGQDANQTPSISQLNADSLALYRDAWVLHQNLIERRAEGDFLASCQRVVIGALESFGSEGGVAGWIFAIDIQAQG